MSGFFGCHTPPKRKSHRDGVESPADGSPLPFNSDSNSPVINWDFPKPRVSQQVKDAAKALAVTMSKVRRKRPRSRAQNFEGSPLQTDFSTSPLSHFNDSPKSSKKKVVTSSFDYEALEKLDFGRLEPSWSQCSSNSSMGNKSTTSSAGCSSSSSSSKSTDTTLKETLCQTDVTSETTQDEKGVASDKELQSSLIEAMLDEDLNFFMTPELAFI